MGIGVSRKQRVFAVLEDTEGTLKFPAAANFIRPAGDAVMNQSPDFFDSEEKQDTLDVLDQFQNATPPGDFTLPMYLRTVASYATPQGDALFQSWQGGVNPTTTASLATQGLAGSKTATGGTIDTIAGGSFPTCGVIKINNEEIHYGSLATLSSTSVRLTDCTRGYRSTTATSSHVENDSVSLESRWYPQDTESPSFSLWIETDHFTQGMSGCSVGSVVLGVNNEGAVTLTFTGNGMEMVWAGKSQLASNSASGATSSITVDDAKLFKVGAYIQNYTKSDTNSGSGFLITESNATANTLKISTGITMAWATDDYIQGYLPSASVLGSAVESRYTDIELDGVAATIKNTDFTFNVPKVYITDEVGTTYPEDYMEDVRDITATLNLYFREADAKYFKEGYDGNEVTFWARFGNTAGRRLEIYMPKCKLQVPTMEFTAPAVNLSMPLKALGDSGEDSCEVVLT